MRDIPDERSTPRLVGAWVWWVAQCVVITGAQLIPDNYAVPKYPRRPVEEAGSDRVHVTVVANVGTSAVADADVNGVEAGAL